jgi:hypothetical protein
MKKVLAVLLGVALALSLMACSTSGNRSTAETPIGGAVEQESEIQQPPALTDIDTGLLGIDDEAFDFFVTRYGSDRSFSVVSYGEVVLRSDHEIEHIGETVLVCWVQFKDDGVSEAFAFFSDGTEYDLTGAANLHNSLERDIDRAIEKYGEDYTVEELTNAMQEGTMMMRALADSAEGGADARKVTKALEEYFFLQADNEQ